MAKPGLPEIDDELRLRLARRFGSAIDPWLDSLPGVLAELAERWELEWDALIRRGSMSVVVRCLADGRPAVLKASPDRGRIVHEAAAIARWQTAHVPAVLAVDERAVALLIEAIEPGTPLVETPAYPDLENLASLMRSLHESAAPDPVYRPLAYRIAHLFDSGLKNYERRPDLAELIPLEVYERGRRLAMRLAAGPAPTVLLHGDLTPVNVLDGGAERGLVAIDPAPCLGDPAFDAVDFVLWRSADVATVAHRAERLAQALGADAGRLLDWCAAFAGMTALEIAEAPGGSCAQVEHFLELASRA
jgi:streptomycin 6-kinase